MKKTIMALVLATIISLVPMAGVLASTTILDGTAAVTNNEPIVITFGSGDGTYDPVTHAWTVSTIGGGTKHLTLNASNTGSVGYTVAATVTPVDAPVGVTASWSPATATYIAAGANKDYTLTIVIAADAPLATANFTFQFTR